MEYVTFRWVERELPGLRPIFNCSEIGLEEETVGRGGETFVKLAIVSVQDYFRIFYIVREVVYINDEEKRAEDRSLRHPGSDW